MSLKYVWVIQGKQPHQAILEERGEFLSRVRWPTLNYVDEVPNSCIQFDDTGYSSPETKKHQHRQPKKRQRNGETSRLGITNSLEVTSFGLFSSETRAGTVCLPTSARAAQPLPDDASSSSFSSTDDESSRIANKFKKRKTTHAIQKISQPALARHDTRLDVDSDSAQDRSDDDEDFIPASDTPERNSPLRFDTTTKRPADPAEPRKINAAIMISNDPSPEIAERTTDERRMQQTQESIHQESSSLSPIEVMEGNGNICSETRTRENLKAKQRASLHQIFRSEKRSDPIVALCDDNNSISVPIFSSKVHHTNELQTTPKNEVCNKSLPDAASPTTKKSSETCTNSISSPARTASCASYTGRSSAYVQNLAEICDTVLSDGRWQGLFRWEYNDDLRAVQALQRLYEPIAMPAINVACNCLLCQDSPMPKDNKADQSARNVREPSKDDTDELTSESLYLYSRLFHRKGPWFRFDNIYNTIIAPSRGQKSDTPTEEIYSEDVAAANSLHESLDHHLSVTLPQLFERISKLTQMGLIRGFDNERECGLVCDDGYIFRMEELSIINSKLGGRPGKKGKASFPSFATRVTRQRTLIKNQTVPLIQQASDVILEKFAVEIVSRCNGTSSIKSESQQSSSIDNEGINQVKKCFSRLRREFKTTFHPFVRLNEDPVLALRRVVRLYLCANSGPGEMRGTETNGWKSVSDVVHKTNRGEICPPSSQLWHKIRYPGLEFRFGLQSFCFMNSYRAVPLETSKSANATRSLPDPIILSRKDFCKWEKCAEIRANVDYLLCCHERDKKNFKSNVEIGQSFDLLDIGRNTGQGQGALISTFAGGLPNSGANLIETLGLMVAEDIWCLPDHLFHSARLLCSIGILCMYVLGEAIAQECNELSILRNRPWLRHLSWHACLATVVSDIVPIFERNRLYLLATRATYLLFHGSLPLIQSLLTPCSPLPLAAMLLSRRTRGKMFDRLLIDIKHLVETQIKASSDTAKRQAIDNFRDKMQNFCVFHCRLGARLASLGFATLRGIAQRLNSPFSALLGNCQVVEAVTLGLRVQKEYTSADDSRKKTNEWEPVVDSSIANSLTEGTAAQGSRTKFVGYEDDDSDVKEISQSRSLNVEEYAMELYKTGRLPVDCGKNDYTGGWVGWSDDEGRMLRMLFRIICGAPILGADYGCNRMADDPMRSSVFLTPFQQLPFDLHVSYQKFEDKRNAFSKLDSSRNSFFQRRNGVIFALREKLCALTSQELCDAVFDSVMSRLHFMHHSGRKDPVLDRDLAQIRTLSALAAGYGGVQLAAAFRCLFFDYRCYAGGLPDIQLFRVLQLDKEYPFTIKTVIDPSWIGEHFSSQHQDAENGKRLQQLFFGDDDEYLGCTKDSSGRWRKSSTRGTPQRKGRVPSLTDIPPRLQLNYNGADVLIECMSIEVKSARDILSRRQVDWLNILDQNGYSARVCKFHASSAAKQKQSSKNEAKQKSLK